ncbi:MAG: phosphoribosylformylglycinamidine synthase subunit PurL [Candidatus Micrarchaeia archaeon]
MTKSISKIKITGLTNDELVGLSRKLLLSLNLSEMKAICKHFEKLERDPTDAELETIAQTWSEHCKHKVFNCTIDYEHENNRETINSLFKTFIKAATEKVADQKKGFLVSVFSDNAGVVSFNENFDVAFKVETHNHPSALDPFGGAGTGIGGVIRDVLGVGLGAKPVFNTDVFCFAPPDVPRDKVPKSILHPKRIFKGVVDGVRSYGNPMGIPTINGSIHFDERYLGNPLVYCGTSGVMPKGMHEKGAKENDAIVVIGGRTGRDGIHGATFSSAELEETTSSSAVQIGNPIEERKVLDVQLQARDRRLYNCVTDCGAGGFSSAVGEMAEKLGCEVWLEKAPLKYAGLKPWEIWVSEAQERMVFSVAQEKVKEFKELCESEDVEFTTIGKFTSSGKLLVKYEDETVCDLDMKFLHGAVPVEQRKATWRKKDEANPSIEERDELTGDLKKILSNWDVCSKEWVVRQYDHEVQGTSALKPLVGIKNDGPSDASVVTPVLGLKKAIGVSNGINPHYGKIDAYWMAASCIDEALRNLVATGCPPDKVAILDNFCMGSPQNPEVLGDLVRACKACYDFATVFETPFISGKDSFYNEYKLGDDTISIPPTLLISAIGVFPNAEKTVSMDAKQAGNSIYVLGETFDEMGGSQYYLTRKVSGGKVPRVNAKKAKALFEALHLAVSSGLVASCHDCSDGGLGVAFSEMSFAGELGMNVDLSKVPKGEEISRNDTVLFSESNSRFVVEVEIGKEKEFENALKGNAFAKVGQLTENEDFKVTGLRGETVVRTKNAELKQEWQKPMKKW